MSYTIRVFDDEDIWHRAIDDDYDPRSNPLKSFSPQLITLSITEDDGVVYELEIMGQFTLVGNVATVGNIRGTVNRIFEYRQGQLLIDETFANGIDINDLINDNVDFSGDDFFYGSPDQGKQDIVKGGAGNDHFHLYGDNGKNQIGDVDFADGGTGIDTSHYRGSIFEYNIKAETFADLRIANNTNTLVQGISVEDVQFDRDGRDHLINTEILQFADARLDLSVKQKAIGIAPNDLKMLQELYVGFFNRIPEADGLKYWIEQLQSGTTMQSIADQFYDAGVQFEIFQNNMPESELITLVYENVLGRSGSSAPDSNEVSYWQNWLTQSGNSKGGMVLQMLEDSHNFFTNDPDVGWVIKLLNNKSAVANYVAVELGLSFNSAQQNISKGIEWANAITPDSYDNAIILIGLDNIDVSM